MPRQPRLDDPACFITLSFVELKGFPLLKMTAIVWILLHGWDGCQRRECLVSGRNAANFNKMKTDGSRPARRLTFFNAKKVRKGLSPAEGTSCSEWSMSLTNFSLL